MKIYKTKWFHKWASRESLSDAMFANLKNKGLRRFTLRGKEKVDAQWKLYTLVHNIEKIVHCGAS